MTRQRRREYLVATVFAAVGCLFLVIAILNDASDTRSLVRSDFSVWVPQADAELAIGPSELTAHGAARDLADTARASQPQPSVDADRPAFLPLTGPGDTVAQTPEAALSLPTKPPSLAVAGSDNSQPALQANNMSPTGHRFIPEAGGGFAPAALPGVGAVQAAEVTKDHESRTERDASEASTQTARVSGARAAGSDSAANSTAAPTTESSAATSAANDSMPPSASLATLLEELTGANPHLGPIVVGGPEAFGGSGFEAAFADVFDEPDPLDVLVGNAAEDLKASFALPGDSGPLPVSTTSVGGNKVVNPEPATLLLLGTGLGLAARYVRRGRQGAVRRHSV